MIGFVALAGIVIAISVYVGVLRHNLERAQTKIDTLNENNGKLQGALTTAQAAVEEQKNELAEVAKELAAITVIDRRTSQQLANVRARLDSPKINAQLDKLRQSPDNSLFLNLLNESTQCEFSHITDASGQCIGGRWRQGK